MLEILLLIVELFVINLILSGDNAVLIASATKKLNEKDRKIATILGALIATLLRFVFIIVIFYLGNFNIPFISFLGGALLFKLALDLTKTEFDKKDKKSNEPEKKTMVSSLTKIIFADFTMSFDNSIVFVGIASNYDVSSSIELSIIAVVLLLSLPIILFGAKVISFLLDKFNFINYIAMFFLLFLGIELLFSGIYIDGWIEDIFGEWKLEKIVFLIFAFTLTSFKYIYDASKYDTFVKAK